MAEGDFITVEEAASRLGVSPATVKRRCADGSLTAQKFGRSWVVDVAKLPRSTPKRPSRRATTASSMTDLPLALRHLQVQDLRRDLWVPDVLRFEDDIEAGLVLNTAAARIDRNEPFDAAISIPVPKSPFFVRNATNLTLPDRLAYQAVVAAVAPKIEARTTPGVYSARLSPDSWRFLKEGAASWVQWKAAVTVAIVNDGPFVIETDITSFFDSISHTVLMQELQGLGMAQPLVDALREMLRAWASAPNTGLPQGPEASRVLANFYMHEIDAQMRSLPGVTYLRYMDDIRIVAPKKHAAVEALKMLDAECRKRNLFLSTKKTGLFEGDDALARLADADIDAAAYAFDANLDPKELREKLKALFRSALGKEGVDGRRAKFSLYRLRALREEGALRLVLSKLEALAPLGWLVPAYLLPWLRRKSVAKGLVEYLTDPERNTSDYLSTWLLAALLDEPHAITPELLSYARSVALDRMKTSYHRAVAVNVVVLGRRQRDLIDLREIVKREFDPEIVRGVLVALHRVRQLDKATTNFARKVQGIQVTVDYLARHSDLPSLVMSGVRNPQIT